MKNGATEQNGNGKEILIRNGEKKCYQRLAKEKMKRIKSTIDYNLIMARN